MSETLHRPGLLALAAAALLLAAPAGADDASLRERVEARLDKAGLDREGEIHVSVDGGEVTLTGGVRTLDALRRAEKAAARESKRVVNRIAVLPEPRSDASVREAAADAVLGYAFYTVFDNVELGVQDGVVLLRGSVRQPYRKQEIEERVAQVEGVRAIVNELRVQPVSLFDDDIRRDLYRAIYQSERFVQYANHVHPPIRIIVENGRVTLAGWVSSPVDQALLGSIARSTSAFGVDNRLRVDGDSPEERESSTGS
jgi:osmotically-inducible protein OsmY